MIDHYTTTGGYGRRVHGFWRKEGRPVWFFVKVGKGYVHVELGPHAFHITRKAVRGA